MSPHDPQVVEYFVGAINSWSNGSIAIARQNFEWCLELDHAAVDALRAMAATEDNGNGVATDDQIEGLWKHRANHGALLRAGGGDPLLINGKYDTGMWDVEHKMCTKSDIALAYACLLIKRHEWDAALKALKDADSQVPFTTVVRAYVYYATKRWGDVLRNCEQVSNAQARHHTDVVSEPPAPDYTVQGLASLMAGEALCRLEKPEAAVARLELATGVSNPVVAARACFLTGMAYRAMSDDTRASAALSRALAYHSTTEYTKAESDVNYRLSTTSVDLTDQRTSYWDVSTEPLLSDQRASDSERDRERLLKEADEELNQFIGMDGVKRQVRKLKAVEMSNRAKERRGIDVPVRSHHILFTGPPGCIQGDALIALNRAGKGFQMKLKDVVRKFNGEVTRADWAWDANIPTYVQREVDGVVRLGKLENAWFSGVKTTYTVTTASGRLIRATDEHPFLTERGWVRLDALVVGDQVHVRGERSSTGRQSKPRYRTVGVANHPFAASRNRVPLHHLVAEATVNGMKYEDFLDTLRRGDVSVLTFLDPAVWAVHHVDLDSSNNKADNLQVLTHTEHHRLHAEMGDENNVQLLIATERVVSVELYGQEDTYDIEVADAPHNFIANGFVVHNTGKTTVARVIGKMYAGLGIVDRPDVLETSRPDFVGDTVGSTGLKTKKIIEKAMDGVLFIDEAYALVQEVGHGQKDAFGQEALDVLVAEMENNRDRLVVIAAGYNRDIERLLATNEGLKSRFSRKVEFHSYSADEIWDIAQGMAAQRRDVFGEGVEELLKSTVSEVLLTRNHEGKTLLDVAGNGRFVRNVLQSAEEERELRHLELTENGVSTDDWSDDEFMTCTVEDVKIALDALIVEYL